MANKAHLTRLRRGVSAWNKWREANHDIKPDLFEADLSEADLLGADLSWADLSWADLSRAKLTKANLIRANLTGAHLPGADLIGADLNMANLSGVYLVGAQLIEADLRGAKLTGADLRGVHLTGAHLTRVHLAEADLTGAHLAEANLTGAILARAVFTRADLTGADLTKADLTGVHLTEASIGWTRFADVNLSAVQGLETTNHVGPSTIGIDTLYRSQGNILEVFLRGAGVPDNMITYSKSLVGRPIESYSCFISYSSRDEEFAIRLRADLDSNGVRNWFAPHDVQAGRKLHEQIDEAIRVHERLLLILSSHSMASEWVKTEIARARQREVQEKRQVLFPIRLVSFDAIRAWECFDADTGKDSAREIREFFIPDFSDWKNREAYRVAFQRLLHDLKASV
jgi:uncharacterized protein YjbI with pentapeptide repeats